MKEHLNRWYVFLATVNPGTTNYKAERGIQDGSRHHEASRS